MDYVPLKPIERVNGGTAIAVGSASCVREDFAKAIEARPDATIFAANRGCLVSRPDHICSFHYYELAELNELALEAWGERVWTLEGGGMTERHKTPDDYPEVDVWWVQARQFACTSGWMAARVAQAYGYDEIIMCGIPMDGRGYFDGDQRPTTSENPRIGCFPDDHKTMTNARSSIANADRLERAGIVSMSGWTREALGGPEWLLPT